MRRIRPPAQLREVGNIYGGNAVGNELSVAKDIGIVEAARYSRLRACPCSIEKMSRIDWDAHHILASRDQELVNCSRADGPHVIQRVGLVRSIKKFWSSIGVSVERLVFKIRVLLPAKREPLLGRYIDIHREGVLALMLRMQRRPKPVAVAADVVGEVGDRPRVHDPDAGRTQTVRRNNVAGEAAALIGCRAGQA